jgi:hypothetical protein
VSSRRRHDSLVGMTLESVKARTYRRAW